MVDYFPPPLRRDSVRLPYDTEPSYPVSSLPCSARSRRSSVSSFAESEVSVFSDASITSSQTSASTHLSSGWDSSPPYDSGDDVNSSLYEVSSESEARVVVNGSICSGAGLVKKQLTPSVIQQQQQQQQQHQAPSSLDPRQLDRVSNPLISSHKYHSTTHALPPTLHQSQALHTRQPQHSKPTSYSQCPAQGPSHPRRTAVDASWSKPTLVTQHDRRVNFVENLVDSATQLVALIWPLSTTEVCNPGRQAGTPVITLRFFIRETLRRSRTSFSTLQVAMYYLALLNHGGQISTADRTPNQALQCGRRMFLASLILASKYLQDRNYFTKAWSRISNLSVAEINRNEMALLSALEYKLHIRSCSFQEWTDGISKCTAAVQAGIECPWVEVLMAQNMWRSVSSSTKLTVGTPDIHPEHKTLFPDTRLSTVPEHRSGLAGIGKSVCPTKPFPLSVRPCAAGKSVTQWQGMAAHLQTRHPAAAPSTNLAQGVSQIFLQEQELPAENSSNLDDRDPASRSSLLSPPKTPESEEERSTIAGGGGVGSTLRRLPPTPKEPLVSLNTTPDSNDGVSTFGNYLGPPSEHSPSDPDRANAQSAPNSQSSVARCKADTLDTREKAVIAANSVGSSLEPSSPDVEAVSSESSPANQTFRRSIAAAVRAEFDSSASYMDVAPDQTPSRINTCVQERTRRLLNPRTRSGFCKDTPTSAVIEDEDVDDKSSRSDLQGRRSVKPEKCQRRKRAAGSFSGDHGLSMRTKKILRS